MPEFILQGETAKTGPTIRMVIHDPTVKSKDTATTRTTTGHQTSTLNSSTGPLLTARRGTIVTAVMTARALKAENAKVQVGTTMATLALDLKTETVMDLSLIHI